MTKITYPKCGEEFYTASPKYIRKCPYCGYGGFVIKEVLIDGKTMWPPTKHEIPV